jgi:hypothetical protein
LDSSWYSDIIFVLQNLQPSRELTKTKAIFLKQKETNICVPNGSMYWKYPGGVLLKFIIEDEAHKTKKEFHKGDCGGHHYWKEMISKILRSWFY